MKTMSEWPLVRVVFDRKKVATASKAGLVQIEVRWLGRRHMISPGVKVRRGEWSERLYVVNRLDMVELNRRIDAMLKAAQSYIAERMEKGEAFTFEGLDAALRVGEEEKMSFPDWMVAKIDARTDLRDTTKVVQRHAADRLREFGCIKSFADLTRRNVEAFDVWMHQRGMKQTTIGTQHKTLKTYVKKAMEAGLLSADPYLGFKVDRGKGEWGRFITPEEQERLRAVKLPTKSLRSVRDLFLLQCHTGLAYADLMAMDVKKIETVDGQSVYRGTRQKTGQPFTAILGEEDLRIIRSHHGLPRLTNQQYNMRLKIVAEAAGIDKPLASHWARRTCGMDLLNDGVPVEVVARVLGHSKIETTQESYARLLDTTVIKAVGKVRK